MEDDAEERNYKKENRKKREKKRSHKDGDKEELSKESFKKMKQEIEEMRKRENERMKELEDLKKKIEDQQKQANIFHQTEYALDFDKEMYLNKGFIESAKWIKDVLAKNMNEKMSEEEHVSKFETLMIAKKSSKHLGARTCARFNTTHVPTRPDAIWTRHRHDSRHGMNQNDQEEARPLDTGRSNEIRLHACTLCIEALGAAYGHGVLDCPWIKEKNWK